ncbi:uncharacterized protein EHS24_007528 [Apiotrichum porosum]|uniref:Uncharacterized protein n=1 Tax=Apiotrichum porosum TaxID=105984 RepID=A0A427XUS5_9TREE|nr:uncharacterized protein EHS24_007528 [Apiotrichum porosum]RSH82547.1 hypothetical protein EHS24_007528 [Apiotrichum porosum]
MLALAAVLFGLQLVAARPAAQLHHASRNHPRAAPKAPRSLPYVKTLATLSYMPTVQSASYVNLTHMMPKVIDNAIAITSHSWEFGVLTQTLLEVYSPNLAPFDWITGALGNQDYLPFMLCNVTANELSSYDWSGAPSDGADSNLNDYLWDSTSKKTLSPQPLLDGAGSLGDPASLGVAAWVLAHYADQVSGQLSSVQDDDAYAWAVGNQLAYLYAGYESDNGTISQREGYFEVWADMGYMISPFMAYLGLATSNTTLLTAALNQWTLDSSALLDTSVNLYRHVNTFDARFWATGNAWMLQGLMRILASIDSAGQTDNMGTSVSTAETTAANVFTALFNQLTSDGRLPNYMLTDDSTLSIADSTGTAGVVAAFYRFYIRRPDLAKALTTKAAQAFDGVVAKIDSSFWLTDVVDPLGTNGFIVTPGSGTQSPEGQSFVALMWAARTAAKI